MHWKLWHWWKKLKMTHRWKDRSHSWFGRTDVIKMTILHKAIYRFNAVPIKTFFFFYRTRTKKILKFVWKHKRYWIPKAILRERNRARGIKLADQIILQSSLTHIRSLSLQQRRQWKKTISSINDTGKTEQLYVKEWNENTSNITHTR